MVPLNELTAETILSQKLIAEVFDQEDELYRAELLASLGLRAAKLKVKTEFREMVATFRRVEKEMKKQEKKNRPPTLVENWTNFTGPYDNILCKGWIASDNGITTTSNGVGTAELLACYHPILPIERLKNLETEKEKIKLAYKRNGIWSELVVPKNMITSANKIVALSDLGISVTSENAKYLVRYLADVENANEDFINVQYSSSKLGWIRNGFIPYDTEIIFDGDLQFKYVFDSVKECGRWSIWTDHMKKLRRRGRIEVKFMLAASFASILVSLIDGLPFFVDLWGETEGGKSVSLAVAASVWADPGESQYIGDFETTDVALEARADLLNHLPMMLDDTNKASDRVRDNFESIVYNLCSGKGKSRSNKDLGLNRENKWRNCILTNGERPLNSYMTQGGAINRILELECGKEVFDDPQETLEVVKKNYGFAGKRFVEVIKELGVDAIKKMQRQFKFDLSSDEKMQKQIESLAIVLTADKIATDYLFRDGQYISMDEAKEVLVDRNELSDNERCYRYILDKIAMNGQRFDASTNCEKWGILEDGYAFMYNQAFDELCTSGGFSKKSFLSWAAKKRIVQTDNRGNPTKQKKIDGRNNRCVCLKVDQDMDTDGFMKVEDTGMRQEELPFR